jgi:periplasmic divalent cation tolerance protein
MNRAERTRMVLVTCGSIAEGRKIARAVVGKRLAACVNLETAPVESYYNWKGKLETAREYLLLMKTTTERLRGLEREVRKLHSYEVAEFLVLEIAAGAEEYLRWIGEVTTQEK